VEIFQEVGPVVSFRLVFDRETGKPKGYGFCEYRDSATALSAMRNLNGFEMNGRALRVDFAEKGLDDKELSQIHFTTPVNPAVGVQSEVSKVLDSMSQSQLHEIILQMKNLIQKNPDHVRHLLINNPQFAYALLQAQVILGTITSDIAKQLLVQNEKIASPHEAMATPPSRPMPSHPPISVPLLVSGPMGPIPVGPMGLGSVGAPVQGGPSGPGFGYQTGQAPFQPNLGPYHPIIQQQPPPPTEHIGDVLPEDQRQLLEHVMNLSPEQIEKLQPQERQQIMQLRQTMMQFNFLPR